MGQTSPYASTAQTLTFKSVFASHPNLPPITSTVSPTSFPLNLASSKPSVKHSYYTKDLMTNSWYQTRAPQRLTSTSAISNDPGLSTMSAGSRHINQNSPLSTTKSDYTVSEGPSGADMFLSPASMQGNGAVRASPPILGRPHECSHLSGGTGSNAGGSSNLHHYFDNETPMCQVCILCSTSNKLFI
jgi:hypothetical protein